MADQTAAPAPAAAAAAPAPAAVPTPAPATTSTSKNPIQAQHGTKLTLHWLEKSRAQRAIWLLEELQLDYELKTYPRTKELLAPPELKAVHPLGKSPVISIKGPADAKETVLAESGFFTEYLCEHFGPEFVPKRFGAGQQGEGLEAPVSETEEYLRYKYYLHYAEGTLMGAMVLKLVTSQLRANSPKFITKRVADRIDSAFVDNHVKSNLAFIESEFKDNAYIAGPSVTGADFVIIYPLAAAWRRGIVNEKEHPKIVAYVKRVEARPAYEKGVQRVKEVFGSYDPNI